MPVSLIKRYQELGIDVVQIYGMTENCGVIVPLTVLMPWKGPEVSVNPFSISTSRKLLRMVENSPRYSGRTDFIRPP